MGSHSAGWFEQVKTRVKKIAEIRRGVKKEQLRDQYAAALAGLDAKPLPGLKTDSSSVAYSADGKRLVFGGYADRSGQPKGPAGLWNLDIDQPHMSVADFSGGMIKGTRTILLTRKQRVPCSNGVSRDLRTVYATVRQRLQ
jgi:hypothetical protein